MAFLTKRSFALVIVLLTIFSKPIKVSASVHSVLTYKQSSTQLGQLVTSSTLVWESYNAKSSQLEFAIEGGKYITEDENYPIYVCRVYIEGVHTSGFTKKQLQRHVCVVSYLKKVQSNKSFDLLVNKGHFGKLGWMSWRKYTPTPPIGAISIGDNYFVARHHVADNDLKKAGADYNLGRLDRTIELGKILVIEGQAEKEYSDGEVLVEVEPFRYELHDIVMNKTSMDIQVNTTELASAILRNDGDTLGLIETVISYNYNQIQYWGSHDGVARGLTTKIIEADSKASEINWGLKDSEKRFETKTVSTNLYPGTALNVTLKGNFTTMEAGYTAKLVVYYYMSSETFSRQISSTVKKATLRDVKLEFSPIYWLNNGTIIPTTTTTTTTEATEPKNTKDPRPINEPPTIYVSDLSKTSLGTIPSPAKEFYPGEVIGDDENNTIQKEEIKDNFAENLMHNKDLNPVSSVKSMLLQSSSWITFFGFLLLL